MRRHPPLGWMRLSVAAVLTREPQTVAKIHSARVAYVKARYLVAPGGLGATTASLMWFVDHGLVVIEKNPWGASTWRLV